MAIPSSENEARQLAIENIQEGKAIITGKGLSKQSSPPGTYRFCCQVIGFDKKRLASDPYQVQITIYPNIISKQIS